LYAPKSIAMPRQQHYGKIMVIIDLFMRETILTHLNNRTQENVALTILKHVIFQREVLRSLRTDNAPKLSSLTGAVSVICEYLKIDQIKTGKHNPRGNSICEIVNQSLGSMIRKLNDQEYRIQALAHSLSSSFLSTLRSVLR
jgi:hypothetical protein